MFLIKYSVKNKCLTYLTARFMRREKLFIHYIRNHALKKSQKQNKLSEQKRLQLPDQ